MTPWKISIHGWPIICDETAFITCEKSSTSNTLHNGSFSYEKLRWSLIIQFYHRTAGVFVETANFRFNFSSLSNIAREKNFVILAFFSYSSTSLYKRHVHDWARQQREQNNEQKLKHHRNIISDGRWIEWISLLLLLAFCQAMVIELTMRWVRKDEEEKKLKYSSNLVER